MPRALNIAVVSAGVIAGLAYCAMVWGAFFSVARHMAGGF